MTETPESWTLSGRWVFPVAGPPLERGVVTICGERIVAIEPSGSRAVDVDFGNAAILPGFVNAHTHLDLSGLRDRCPPRPDFTDWLRDVIRHRRSQTREQVESDIRAGLAESLKYGTLLLGDIAAGGSSWALLSEAPLRSVVFYELLGLLQGNAETAWSAAENWHHAHTATANCRPGLSPHAPYSVRDWLYYKAAVASQQFRLPLATHLAETTAESELLENQSGPFVSFLLELGVWDRDPAGFVNSPEDVCFMWKGYEAACRLFVHGNYLDPMYVAIWGGTLVYCPRTHAAFGHPPHPFREFLARGVRVAIGTDSLASNPDLDVLAEIRFIHQKHPDVPGNTLLRMATLSGAEALGWADETGSLAPGKSADLVVLPLPDEECADPHHLVLGFDLPVLKVLWRGQWAK